MQHNSRLLSFKYAYEGFTAALKEEPNLKIHFLISLIVIGLSFYLQITRSEWLAIIVVIGFVFALELTNTAIESIVDAFTDKEHPGAKLAKDIAAAAVLVSAITALITGLIIFLPYLL